MIVIESLVPRTGTDPHKEINIIQYQIHLANVIRMVFLLKGLGVG